MTATIEHEPTRANYNPYLAARRAWDERYGDLITRARNWCGFQTMTIAIPN